jgi:hypothetical protein
VAQVTQDVGLVEQFLQLAMEQEVHLYIEASLT